MRILVLSDSHGRVGPMEEAVEAEIVAEQAAEAEGEESPAEEEAKPEE